AVGSERHGKDVRVDGGDERIYQPTVLSLFSGAGGLDLGFAAAGFKTAAFVEIEEWACDTLHLNHSEVVVLGPPRHSGDDKEITLDGLEALAPGAASPDVVIGGPPCQPFSVAAAQRFLRGDKRFKRTGHADEHRGTLFLDFYRIVAETKPRALL